MRGILALSCSLLTIPVFGILAFTHVYPLVATLWLGVTYSFAAVSTKPCTFIFMPPTSKTLEGRIAFRCTILCLSPLG